MEVRFVLTRVLTHQSQDGVVAAGVHHGLAVLDRPDGEVLQLVLKVQMVSCSDVEIFMCLTSGPVGAASPWSPGRSGSRSCSPPAAASPESTPSL